MAPLRAGTEFPRVHVLDHAVTQRGDGIRVHGKLLSGEVDATRPCCSADLSRSDLE